VWTELRIKHKITETCIWHNLMENGAGKMCKFKERRSDTECHVCADIRDKMAEIFYCDTKFVRVKVA
jgi:hypothetical protein